MLISRQTRWDRRPLLHGAEMPGAMAVLFLVARWRQLSCLGSRTASWCCVGVTVPANLFREEGAIISPSLMARQEQTPLAQEHPVQRDVKIEAGRQQCGTCNVGAKHRARETKLPLG